MYALHNSSNEPQPWSGINFFIAGCPYFDELLFSANFNVLKCPVSVYLLKLSKAYW